MNKITIIKTNSACFITDCDKTKGYDYEYHKTNIEKYLFDGKYATKTYVKNWYMIEDYPKLIQNLESDKKINVRWELIDKELESKKAPLIISVSDFDYDYEHPMYALYEQKYDIQKGKLVEANVELELLMEVENFELPPEFSYVALKKYNYSTKLYTVTNADIKHQWLDKMVIPEIMLSERACMIDSSTLYGIVRNHVRENIDNSYARITSDYDFCFQVDKKIPLYEPKEFSYKNPFASTKKARQKLHHSVSKYKESKIFEMTTTSEMYQGYTPIQPIAANNEKELKQKLDGFLEDLMFHINRHLISCPHCEGTGYTENITKFDTNKRD